MKPTLKKKKVKKKKVKSSDVPKSLRDAVSGLPPSQDV
jgi:hypothetical protein